MSNLKRGSLQIPQMLVTNPIYTLLLDLCTFVTFADFLCSVSARNYSTSAVDLVTFNFFFVVSSSALFIRYTSSRVWVGGSGGLFSRRVSSQLMIALHHNIQNYMFYSLPDKC